MKSYIPTINISSLLKSEFETKSAINTLKKIEKACVEVGFFQIIGHGINIKKIDNICKIGNKFFNSSEKNKNKLAPKKWNKKNKNIYRGYFPNSVNGKEGLDIGDLRITSKISKRYKSPYIEYLNLNKSLSLAIRPSSFITSHITELGFSLANFDISTEASVCPALSKTPPCLATRGKT